MTVSPSTVSHWLLWFFVILNSVMLLAILRHMGSELLETSPKQLGPVVGKPPPEIELKNLRGDAIALADEDRPIRHVVFLSTTCKVCEHLLRAVEDVVATDNIVFVIKGDSERISELVSRHELDERIVVADAQGRVFREWNVGGSPFVVVLDGGGVIENSGSPSSRAQFDAIAGQAVESESDVTDGGFEEGASTGVAPSVSNVQLGGSDA